MRINANSRQLVRLACAPLRSVVGVGPLNHHCKRAVTRTPFVLAAILRQPPAVATHHSIVVQRALLSTQSAGVSTVSCRFANMCKTTLRSIRMCTLPGRDVQQPGSFTCQLCGYGTTSNAGAAIVRHARRAVAGTPQQPRA